MGELGTAGQFQQRPTPRGGGMFPGITNIHNTNSPH
jgi:hypothetical protein